MLLSGVVAAKPKAMSLFCCSLATLICTYQMHTSALLVFLKAWIFQVPMEMFSFGSLMCVVFYLFLRTVAVVLLVALKGGVFRLSLS